MLLCVANVLLTGNTGCYTEHEAGVNSRGVRSLRKCRVRVVAPNRLVLLGVANVLLMCG